MQLKIRRSQREGGAFSKNVIFCLDARAEYTPTELADIKRYKLHGQVIYNSEASKRLLDKGGAAGDGSTRGALKSLAFTALAAMRLNISIGSLERGHHIECKSLDELLAAENALMEACENLTEYLNAAATFDGREVVVDFAAGRPQLVAAATPAAECLVTPLPPAPPALEHHAPEAEYLEPQPEPSHNGWSDRSSVLDITKGLWADEDMRRGLVVSLLIVLVIIAVARCS